jgi:hypothetical protein
MVLSAASNNAAIRIAVRRIVLRTNTDLNPLEVMLCYRQLWTVEQTFRTAKLC